MTNVSPKHRRGLPGEYPEQWPPVLLHHFLLQGCRGRPDAIAIEDQNGIYTFRDLAQRAHAFAGALSDAGLQPGDRVMMAMEPCREAVALICACSMTGLIWVPVGMDTPATRMQQIAEISESRLFVTHRGEECSVDTASLMVRGQVDAEALTLDGSIPDKHQGKQRRVIESDLAYIIFTSGTTGRPKGIMMSHRAALVFFRGLAHHCALDTSARVGSFSPLQFDFCLLDMAAALGSMCTLVFVPRMLFHKPKSMVKYLADKRISQMQGVPSIWSSILRFCKDDLRSLDALESILFAGEDFPLANLRALREALPKLRIINCFGQSESIACTFADVPLPVPDDLTSLAIGNGHPGTEMLLLDEQQQPITQPDITGEIYLRAGSLFSGYWNDPETTRKALVPDPTGHPGSPLVFRTGDLAYFDSQGDLHFVGRRDLQVQIHGNRVELAEIEKHLASHEAIAEVAVLADIQGDVHTIHAFLTCKPGHEPPDLAALRAHCRAALPVYMIPSQFVWIERIPLSSNGKVDRSALRQFIN